MSHGSAFGRAFAIKATCIMPLTQPFPTSCGSQAKQKVRLTSRFSNYLRPLRSLVRPGTDRIYPGVHADDYHRAIARLMENVSVHRNEAWDQSMLLSAAAAQAVAKGHVDVAEALLNLDAHWIAKINNCEFD